MGALEDMKAKITDRIRQSIAQSGVELSAIPREQLTILVDSIADGVLLALDEMLEDIGLPQRSYAPTLDLEKGEEVLWQGRPFLSLVEHYAVTSERVRVTRGLLGKQREDIELARLQDIDHKQDLGERVLNLGDIYLRSANPSAPLVTLRNVTDPQRVHEIIRAAMIDARRRHRFAFQEEM